MATQISMVPCQKGPTRHAYAWQIGPFWQDTLDMCIIGSSSNEVSQKDMNKSIGFKPQQNATGAHLISKNYIYSQYE